MNLKNLICVVCVVGACGLSTTAPEAAEIAAADLHNAASPVRRDQRAGADAESNLRSKLITGTQLTSHFMKSHSAGLIMRPLGSARSLLALTVNATLGLLKDTALDLFFFPALGKDEPAATGAEAMNLAEWEQHLDEITDTKQTSGTINILIDGEAFFDRLITQIAESRKSIEIYTYIFDNDDYAIEIGGMLKERSADIAVDIYVDGIGTLGGGMIKSASLPKDFVAPASIKAHLEADSNVNFYMRDKTWFMGDHTKAFVFDDKVAFLGGMNVGREYRYDWHDMMVELSGPVVQQLDNEVEKTAIDHKLGDLAVLTSGNRGGSSSQPSKAGESALRLLYTKPHDAQIYRAQVAAIQRSQSYILIENAYLADDLIIYELAKARQRGVDVRVIVPARPDSGLMDRSNILAINRLVRHGVKVYLYPGMTHVKAAIYDGWASFGTANFDKLSFKVNKEVNIGTSDPRVVAALQQQLFGPDLAISQEVLEEQPTNLTDHVYEKIVDIAL